MSDEPSDYFTFKKGNHLVHITQSKKDFFDPPSELTNGHQNVLML